MRRKTLYSKSEWKAGPWSSEPDHVTWIHPVTSYPCMAKRNLFGAWCGYVGLDDRHPLFLSEVGCEEFKYIEVHGAISMAGYFNEDALLFAPPRKLWWVGFDAMQENDLCPYFETEVDRLDQQIERKLIKGKRNEEPILYRDLDFIIGEIDSLAMQLSNFDARMGV
jgi:hypothetical protein